MATETRDEILGNAWEIIYDLKSNYTGRKYLELQELIDNWNLKQCDAAKIFIRRIRINDYRVRIYIEDDYVDCKTKMKVKKKSMRTIENKRFTFYNLDTKKERQLMSGKVHFMLKLKIFDTEVKLKPEYLFSDFEELYNILLNTHYLSYDCDYLTGYILEKFNIKEDSWEQFLNDLNEKNLDTDYYNDFDKFLKNNNIDYSINNLTEQDYYNIISENLNVNGSYIFFYSLINSNIDFEINEILINFFDKSGNNIIENLEFRENLLNEKLPTLELRQKFLLLFTPSIVDHLGIYLDDLYDKYCVIFEDKIYNSEYDRYMFINSPNFDIYNYDYEEEGLKKFIASYEVNGDSKEWVFYAENEVSMDEMLFGYKIPLEDEDSFHTLYISEF
jgi:hypothetical protein